MAIDSRDGARTDLVAELANIGIRYFPFCLLLLLLLLDFDNDLNEDAFEVGSSSCLVVLFKLVMICSFTGFSLLFLFLSRLLTNGSLLSKLLLLILLSINKSSTTGESNGGDGDKDFDRCCLVFEWVG